MSFTLLFNQPPADQQLIQAAKAQYAGKDYREALVLSHIGIEVAADQALASWINKVEPLDLQDWLLNQIEHNHNLGTEKVRQLFESVSGKQISQQPFWGQYLKSNQLRNKVMHKGIEITAEEAEVAISNAEQMITYLREQSEGSGV